MSPVRVLLIGPSLDILGGQAVQAMHLLNGMKEVDSVRMEFLPINPRLPGPLGLLQKIKFVRTAVMFTAFFLRLLVAAARNDVIHVFTAAYYGFLLWCAPAVCIGRLYRKKVMLHYHDGQCEDHLRNWRTARPVLRMAHQIVAPTYFIVDVMKKFGFDAQCIFNVIAVDQFHYRQREQLRPVFMTNRILEPLYNVGCILRGFALIQQRYPGATLTVAHDGCCRPELEQLARDLALRNVAFVGKVPHDRVGELYDDADIYMMTPNTDCMPGSVFECYASGLPIIATNAGGIPYILRHEETGLLIPVNDHAALAQAAFRLLDDPPLVESLTTAGRRECDRYLWVNIRQQWVDAYRRLAH
jgi:glycosyltransferase involved in cell wall biosynthesis